MATQEERNLKHLQYEHLAHKFHEPIHTHPHSYLEIAYHELRHMIEGHHHHHAIIDQDSVKSPETSDLSTKSKLNRSVYGLYKIRQFNPRFFSPEERYTIDPKPIGILRTFQYGGFIVGSAGITMYCLLRRDFRPIMGLRIAALLGTNSALFR